MHELNLNFFKNILLIKLIRTYIHIVF